MRAEDIRLPPGEDIVWRGPPQGWRFAVDAFRLREIGIYCAVLIALQIWRSVERGEGLAGAAPSALLICAAFAVFAGIAWRMARTTLYVATTRRLLLRYGVAMRATLSLPFSRVERISLALDRGGVGDILIDLKPGERVSYVRLWPLAFGLWTRAGARPLLRAVPDAAVVGGLVTRAAFAAAKDDQTGATAAICAPAPSGRGSNGRRAAIGSGSSGSIEGRPVEL